MRARSEDVEEICIVLTWDHVRDAMHRFVNMVCVWDPESDVNVKI